jgi:predicted RNA-binding protein with PIN domain
MAPLVAGSGSGSGSGTGTDVGTSGMPQRKVRLAKRYIIDGYNYLYRARLMRGRLEDARARLVARLRPLARGGDEVHFVWDAQKAPPDLFDAESHGEGLRSHFARGGAADDRIVEMVRRARDPGRLVVVSDDREVTGRARALGARAESVSGIERRVAPREPDPPEEEADEKPPPPSPGEVDAWLRYFGEEP